MKKRVNLTWLECVHWKITTCLSQEGLNLRGLKEMSLPSHTYWMLRKVSGFTSPVNLACNMEDIGMEAVLQNLLPSSSPVGKAMVTNVMIHSRCSNGSQKKTIRVTRNSVSGRLSLSQTSPIEPHLSWSHSRTTTSWFSADGAVPTETATISLKTVSSSTPTQGKWKERSTTTCISTLCATNTALQRRETSSLLFAPAAWGFQKWLLTQSRFRATGSRSKSRKLSTSGQLKKSENFGVQLDWNTLCL